MKLALTIPVVIAAFSLLTIASTALAEETAEVNVKEFDWCTLSAPASADPTEKASATIKVKGEAIKENGTLHIDLHKFVGKDRVPGAGRATPIPIEAGADLEHTVDFDVPADANALAFVFYVVPEGKTGFPEASHTGGVGSNVAR